MLIKVVENDDYNDIICSFESSIKKELTIGDIIDDNFEIVELNVVKVIETK